MKKKIFSHLTRKTFLKRTSLFTLSSLLGLFSVRKLFSAQRSLSPRKKRYARSDYDLAAVTGNNIELITRKSIELLGGIKRFVKKNDVVVVKPNIGWNRAPEYAANTNPEVVATVIRMCYEAGAKLVKVFDYSCNNIKMSYKNSGIQAAAKKAGAQVQYVSKWKFIPGKFPNGSAMQDWGIYRDAVYCDCFINIPIAKHHYYAEITLAMKNLMGVCADNRGQMHWKLDRNLADLTGFIKPDLNIIDGYRVLLRNGPGGGNIKDVSKKRTIIASTDPVLADSYAASKLFRKNPRSLGYLVEGAKQKLGTMDINKANIKVLKLKG